MLDLACGPGGWACDLARLYPQIKVIGVDVSEKIIRYAQAHAQVQRLGNVSFQMMDVFTPFEFPDTSFDFVNARLVSGFMPVAIWPSFVQECVRITRPGGVIRLTEAEWHFTNSAACERIADMLTRAMWQSGKSFSPDGKRLGAQAMSGLGGIGKTQIAIEYAYQHRQDYQALLWARAESRETLTSSFVEIAALLNLPEKDAQDQTLTVKAVKHWLQTRREWLLILDNVDELTVIREFLPNPLEGHILLTTRA